MRQAFFDRCIQELSPNYYEREDGRLELLFGKNNTLIMLTYIAEYDSVVFSIFEVSSKDFTLILADSTTSQKFIDGVKAYITQ